jgi:hypothetical protein
MERTSSVEQFLSHVLSYVGPREEQLGKYLSLVKS